jgi:hypothetical protein
MCTAASAVEHFEVGVANFVHNPQETEGRQAAEVCMNETALTSRRDEVTRRDV